MMDNVLCVEQYGRKSISVYRRNAYNGGMQSQSNIGRATSFKQLLQTIFLPQGYPRSVSEDYFEYQVWDTVQAFCSSITGTLATQAVLKGSGVGDKTANVASATITWLLKDGTGMVGRIAFAYFKGNNLDCNAKQWRLFGDVLNDCGIFVQLIVPMMPKVYFTPVMCLAGLAFSLVGVAGGCTRAALTMHQAKRDNMADVSAKDGSQETLVNLTALIVNLFLTPIVAGNLKLTWFLFMTFTLFHIYANYRAVSCVVMETLNLHRLRVLVQYYFANSKQSEILTLKQANAKEPLFWFTSLNGFKVKLGCSLEELQLSADTFSQRIHMNPTTTFLSEIRDETYYISLRDSARTEDMIIACCEAEISWIFKNQDKNVIKTMAYDFITKLEAKGWDLNRHHLSADEWRWSMDEIDKLK